VLIVVAAGAVAGFGAAGDMTGDTAGDTVEGVGATSPGVTILGNGVRSIACPPVVGVPAPALGPTVIGWHAATNTKINPSHKCCIIPTAGEMKQPDRSSGNRGQLHPFFLVRLQQGLVLVGWDA
jgi:hypothetical protein